jgi:outer membrane protein assembly factor BamB
MRYHAFTAIMLLATTAGLPQHAAGGDWPQILGPTRNGLAVNEHLLTEWPVNGLTETWQYTVGSGFAGPAVVGDAVYIFHRVGNVERLDRLDAATGKLRWKVEFAASYAGGVNPDTGPRCVPLVHGDNAYLFGASGDLHCVNRETGRTVWTRAAGAEYSAADGYFGFGSTPIVVDELLLVNVGGTSGAGIVAFALDTGKTVWKATDEAASYSSPSVVTLDDKPHALFVTRSQALAIVPTTGEVRFHIPFGRRGPTVNAATPLILGQRMFLTSSYGVGCLLARLGTGQPDIELTSDNLLSCHYNTPILVDNHLYGVHGREDVGRAELRCVDLSARKVTWNVPDFGVANMILADSKLLILKVDGTLLLADPDTKRFAKRAEATVSEHTTRALPALSAGKLYFRDNDQSGGTLRCVQVGR